MQYNIVIEFSHGQCVNTHLFFYLDTTAIFAGVC